MKNIIIGLLSLAILVTPVFAGNNLVVNCDNSHCSVSPASTPLFFETNIVPGYQQTQQLQINNLRSDSCSLILNSASSSDSILSSKISIEIKKDLITYFSGSLTLLNSTENIHLDTLFASASHLYQWTAALDSSVGNEYQNQASKFDLTLNFTCDDQATTPTPTSTSTPTPLPPRLNELMPGPSDGQEWFEIYNPNPFPITLSGWQIDDIVSGGGSPKLIPDVTIPANSVHSPNISISSYFNNGTDDIRLLDNLNNQIDIFHYTSYSPTESWSRQSDSAWCLATPTRNGVNNPCFGIGGDDSQTQGITSASSISTVCTAPAPNAPVLLSATPGTNSVTLNWSEPSSPLTYYLIAYGISPGNYLYGNPNVGGPGTTSYTVNLLSANQQYCFVVRAGNDCMPGSFSNEICVYPFGSILSLNTPAPGFSPEILGDQTTPESFSLPSIQGATNECSRRWLPVLYLLALLLNALFLSNHHRRLFLPLFFSFLAYLIDSYFLRTRCCFAPDWYCRWFWLGNVISFFLPIYLYRKLGKKS